MLEMKSCPFCGGRAIIDVVGDGVGHTKYKMPYVYFPTCLDSHCLGRNKTKYYKSREEAIKKWNERHR